MVEAPECSPLAKLWCGGKSRIAESGHLSLLRRQMFQECLSDLSLPEKASVHHIIRRIRICSELARRDGFDTLLHSRVKCASSVIGYNQIVHFAFKNEAIDYALVYKSFHLAVWFVVRTHLDVLAVCVVQGSVEFLEDLGIWRHRSYTGEVFYTVLHGLEKAGNQSNRKEGI